MLVYSCNHLTGGSFLLSLLLPSHSPSFVHAKHIEEIYTVYCRSEHVLLVKLNGQDNRENIFRYSREEKRERIGKNGGTKGGVKSKERLERKLNRNTVTEGSLSNCS